MISVVACAIVYVCARVCPSRRHEIFAPKMIKHCGLRSPCFLLVMLGRDYNTIPMAEISMLRGMELYFRPIMMKKQGERKPPFFVLSFSGQKSHSDAADTHVLTHTQYHKPPCLS